MSEDNPRPFVSFTEMSDWMAAMMGVYVTRVRHLDYLLLPPERRRMDYELLNDLQRRAQCLAPHKRRAISARLPPFSPCPG